MLVCRRPEQQAGRRQHSDRSLRDRHEGPLSHGAGAHRHPDGPLSCRVRRRVLSGLQVSERRLSRPSTMRAQPNVRTLTRLLSDLQPEPLQLRRGLPVQQPGPHPAGRPSSPGHIGAAVPGRRGHRHLTGEPGVRRLHQVCSGSVLQRPGQSVKAKEQRWGECLKGGFTALLSNAGVRHRRLRWRNPGLRRSVQQLRGGFREPEQQQAGQRHQRPGITSTLQP